MDEILNLIESVSEGLPSYFCITMWKLETSAKGNFVYVSLLKQQGNSDFEFISVSFSAVTLGYIRYQHTVSLKLYDLKIESFFIAPL